MKDLENLMQSAFTTEEYDKIKFTSEFAAKLVKARLSKNLTQSQLAKIIGLNQSAIARIENQGVIPRIDTIVKIAKALEMELDFFPIGTREIEKQTDHALMDIVQNLISEIKQLREETLELKTQIKELRYENKLKEGNRWGSLITSQDGGNRIKKYLGQPDDNAQPLRVWIKHNNFEYKINRIKIGDIL